MAWRMHAVALEHWVDPETLAAALFEEDGNVVWLDPSDGSAPAFLGVGDESLVAYDGPLPATEKRREGAIAAPALLDALRDRLRDHREGDGPAAARLGWNGWFGYEFGRTTVPGALPGGSLTEPVAAFTWTDRGFLIDPASRSVTAVLLVEEGDVEPERWLRGWTDRMADLASRSLPPLAPDAPPSAMAEPRHAPGEYVTLVERCRAAIRDGSAYQLCLTNTLTVSGIHDAVAVYRRLRRLSPTHHGGLLRIGGRTLLSASPEQFLAVNPSGRVVTRPIKGTRPRSEDPAEDARLAGELTASVKERAENLMIVDLMRNDLARVCRVGSVAVDELFALESYPQVHQLVSTVSGTLCEGYDALDAVAACFPAGSMTGAPKHRAMQILAELEQGPRGIYAGAFGSIGVDGSLDLAMVIRSIVLEEDRALIGAGGGITTLSEAVLELEETEVKARALLHALRVPEPQIRPRGEVPRTTVG